MNFCKDIFWWKGDYIIKYFVESYLQKIKICDETFQLSSHDYLQFPIIGNRLVVHVLEDVLQGNRQCNTTGSILKVLKCHENPVSQHNTLNT